MAEPSKKSPELEILSDICSWCGKSAVDFRDALSRKEYTISGFCQECQDKTFGEPEGDE